MNYEEKFPIGSWVEHEDFGLGVVIDYEKNSPDRPLIQFRNKSPQLHNGNNYSKYKTVGEDSRCWYAYEYEFKPRILNNKLNRKLYPNYIENNGFLLPTSVDGPAENANKNEEQ